MQPMEMIVRDIIGPDSDAITWWQMSVRGVIVFLFAIALIRMGDKRIFGKSTALDIVLGIILGSNLSRAITANAPFFPTLITSAIMVLVHWLLAKFAYHSKAGSLVKGHEQQLVEDGQFKHEEMKKHQITEHDVYEAMRLEGKCLHIEEVKAAFLERNGSISIITKK